MSSTDKAVDNSVAWMRPLNASIAGIFVALAAASYLCSPLYSAELYWHLTLGRWLIVSQSLPTHDLWTIAGAGQEWRAASWLFDLLVFFLKDLFDRWDKGFLALVVFKLSLCSLFLLVLAHSYTKRSKSAFFGTMTATIVAAGALTTVSLTPTLCGYVLYPLIIHLVYESARHPSKVQHSFVFFVSLLAANLSEAALAISLTATVLYLSASSEQITSARARFIVLLFVPLFLTPYGGMQIIDSVRLFAHDVWFQTTVVRHGGTVYDYPSVFLILLWLLFAMFLSHGLSRSKLQTRRSEVVVALLYSLLAFAVPQYSAYALIMVGLLLSLTWSGTEGASDESRNLGPVAEGIILFRNQLMSWPFTGVIWLLLALIFLNTVNVIKQPVLHAALPEREVSFLLEQSLLNPEMTGAVLHEAAIAPYLIYRFSDVDKQLDKAPMRVIIDFRTIALNPAVARAEYDFRNLLPGWNDYLRYAEPRTAVLNTRSPAFQLFLTSPEWQLKFIAGRKLEDIDDKSILDRLGYNWAVFVKT